MQAHASHHETVSREGLNDTAKPVDHRESSRISARDQIMYHLGNVSLFSKLWALEAAILVSIAMSTLGCTGEIETRVAQASISSCMKCHNGSTDSHYDGPGIRDPHPFPGAAGLSCVTCHGGNPQGGDQAGSHVPPPPEIGDREFQRTNRKAYFNRLTLTGLDKFNSYDVNGVTYNPVDFIQFINPGDLRVVNASKGCGACHESHGEMVQQSLLATEAGILSGALYGIGVNNKVAASQGLYTDTASDTGFRAITDPDWVFNASNTGAVGELVEFPTYSAFGKIGPNQLHQSADYDVATLASYLQSDNSVLSDSPLAQIFHEQVAFTCGDCHLGSAGANDRYGDYRSSGCTACHMPYSLDGRSRSQDPNVPKNEPLDPDDIDEPEHAHVRTHRIMSVKKTFSNGESIEGIDDYACAGCHQGSNRTVMQYWGIRLDQNQDVRRGEQYPANPVSYKTTRNDTRLFDPDVGNRTFNGRNANQYLLEEDYDGDGRDDTPADVHYEAGLGCIDCHGSFDLHGGDVTNPNGGGLKSRMEHGVRIRCESCHGSHAGYAVAKSGLAFDGQIRDLAVGADGNIIDHVVREADGHYYLTSRVTGVKHFVPQTMDTIVDNGKVNPLTQAAIYSERASYSMGRKDGNAATGIGPQQTGGSLNTFSHMDSMSCASCHSAWTNNCVGCHLEGEYSTNQNNFSNITGERIVFREKFTDFVYQSPVLFQLGVGPDNKIHPIAPSTQMFFRYEDRNNDRSQVFTFSDRNGGGSNPAVSFPSMSHNTMLAHSIRGKVTATKEGPRYCVSCHLTSSSIATYGTEYTAFRAALSSNNFAAIDFNLLQSHIGSNPGNQLDSPMWVHMVAGLGSGMFLFDAQGRPMNPLDTNANRKGCDGVAPSTIFRAADVAFDLDRMVTTNGVSKGSNKHSMLKPGQGNNLRDGSTNPTLAGPLGKRIIERLTDPSLGIVLDSWLDADGATKGGASTYVK